MTKEITEGLHKVTRNPYLDSPEFRAKHAAMKEAGRKRKKEFEAALLVAEASAGEPEETMSVEAFLDRLHRDDTAED